MPFDILKVPLIRTNTGLKGAPKLGWHLYYNIIVYRDINLPSVMTVVMDNLGWSWCGLLRSYLGQPPKRVTSANFDVNGIATDE